MLNKIKNQIIQFITLILFIAIIAGCNSNEIPGSKNPILDENPETQIDEAFHRMVKANSNFLVEENENFRLYINGKTSEIILESVLSGYKWFSNPNDRAQDPIAGGLNAELLNSTLIVEYYPVDSNTAVFMNSYTNSMTLDQVQYEKIEQGIRVNYGIGKKRKVYTVPYILSKERFEYLREQLSDDNKFFFDSYYGLVSLEAISSDSDRALFQEAFPILRKKDVYIFASGSAVLNPGNPASSFLLLEAETILASIGYTKEDLEFDNAENELVPEDEKEFFVEISLDYKIEGESLLVTIPSDSILYDSDIMRLSQIYLLPNFGAGGTSEDGYLFIPDGSGTLINFNNGKTDFPEYSKEIYGKDMAIESKNISQSQIHFPIFGIKKEDEAFLGIIEKGDASASIRADISEKTTSYNKVYASFQLINRQRNMQSILNIAGMMEYQRQPLESDLQIRYLFLSAQKANYPGMALAYKDYLFKDIEINENQSSDTKMMIEMIGAVDQPANFMGFPYIESKSLTSYDQALTLVNLFKESGIDPFALIYTGWSNKGVNGSLPNKIKTIRSLGNKKEFAKLNNFMQLQGLGFYPDIDIMSTRKTNLYYLITARQQITRDITDTMANVNKSIHSLTQASQSERMLLSPKEYLPMSIELMKDYNKMGMNAISLSSAGIDLTADYKHKNPIDRQMAKDYVTEMLESVYATSKISVSGANAYTLPYTSFVTGLNYGSDQYYIFDKTVPFMQIVLNGKIPYSGGPLNMSSDIKRDFLRNIESGTIPAFRLIYEDNYSLKDTDFMEFALNYSFWIEEMLDIKEQMDEIQKYTDGATIDFHEYISDNLTVTRYDSGTKVYVNYSNEEVNYESITIPGMGYFIMEGDSK